MAVRKEMLNHLESGRPTVIAGDINTSECVIRHWMQTTGAPFAPFLANSGAPDVQHGDYTIATNLFLWQVNHQIGKSFEAPNTRAIDCVSDAHDMVCVILSCIPQRKRVTTDAAELGCWRKEVTTSSANPIAADGAVLVEATEEHPADAGAGPCIHVCLPPPRSTKQS